MASRRSRTRRDKRAPITDFDEPQPRTTGAFFTHTQRSTHMIGDQVTGTIPGAHITSVAHEAPRAAATKKPQGACSGAFSYS